MQEVARSCNISASAIARFWQFEILAQQAFQARLPLVTAWLDLALLASLIGAVMAWTLGMLPSTQYCSDKHNFFSLCSPASLAGKGGIEVICRKSAVYLLTYFPPSRPCFSQPTTFLNRTVLAQHAHESE